MDFFKTKEGVFTDSDFADALSGLNLKGANLYLCSSLLSLGRPMNMKVPEKLIEIVVDQLGTGGTLTIPSYSFSGYNKEIFDPETSKCIVGTLGETARKMPGFIRTIHPVYSHSVTGKYLEKLNGQKIETCFGKESYFDIFCSIPNSVIIVLGSSLSALAFYHCYDQLFNAPGRFVKKFNAKIKEGDLIKDIEFDSFVKDYDNFYTGTLMNCLGRFDALATELGVLKHIPFAGNYIHCIKENDFRRLYEACLKVDQKYFLCSTKNEWEEYYPKNNFTLFHGKLENEKILKIRRDGKY